MNKMKTTCFRDEIRKSLIYHALAPCILSLVVLVLVFMAAGIYQIQRKNKRANEMYSGQMEALLGEYLDKNSDLSGGMDLELFSEDSSYRVRMISDIYQFLNSRQMKGDYYLFDREKRSVFSSQSDPADLHYMEQYLRWEMSGRMEEGKRDAIFIYGRDRIGERPLPSWVLFRPVLSDGKICGYSGFVLPSDRFSNQTAVQDMAVLITNRFHRIFAQNGYQFQDERGKLQAEFRGADGMILFGERYYYASSNWILEGTTRILTVYDCTSLIQLCMMAVFCVVVLGLLMTWAIYRSAGTLAGKKTEILYELISALGQVEKGDLNVSVSFHTGDEFERIGNSFNMMLGSLRHLIARHQELARENMLATVQMLEAQFHPHFLFNTLESIRYMIRFEPKDAERMTVNLSKLLRYSIQNGKDKVELLKELQFIDRYLQIMLYRYGERLRYRIEETCGGNIPVPRMILQPIVENSIKYGFGEEKEILTIVIRAEYDGENLVVSVTDDGTGMEEDLLGKLKESLEQKHNVTEHIGLYNVDRRIRLTYGTGYGITIRSRKGEGTVVSLLIPGIEKAQI